jgi:hypothetical protein
MVKRIKNKRIESNRFRDFYKVADDFYEGAKTSMEFEYYNAAGVLAVHSAIAYADALTIKIASQKSSGDNHYDVINLLDNIIPDSLKKRNALLQLGKLIDHKNFVSYSGELSAKTDIEKHLKFLERFKSWVNEII